VKYKKAGYAPNGAMNKKGFEAIAPEYEMKTNLVHTADQLRSRWTQLRRMFSWYREKSKSTGIVLLADGAIDADQFWWNQNSKVPNLFRFLRCINSLRSLHTTMTNSLL
jgi:hypothetical protein